MSAPNPTGPDGPHSRPAWAHYLISLRNRRGLSAKDVAARLGITAQTYAGIEAGARTRDGRRTEVALKDETVHRIIEALNLTSAERHHLIALVITSAGNRSPWQTRLKLARVTATVTVQQAARAAGVADDTYREWERKGTGAPRHDLLRKVLHLFGWTPDETADFMAAVPPDAQPARAPQQPTNPVHQVPAWSAHITQSRVAAGLYLSQVDERVGQQSIVRRFELGGWPRADGRLSVPTSAWLNRVADALDMTPEQTVHLHELADVHRVALAQSGATQHQRPLLAELLHEARKTTILTRVQATVLYRLPPGTWSRAEHGAPAALATYTPELIEALVTGWDLGAPLAEALRTAVGPIGPATCRQHP